MLTYFRPGFGGSTPVELSQRISTFVEVVPLLLAHLRIKHVAIATQSAGTIYGLNLLSQRPDILSPTNPSITFFSPWVHQSHTSVSLLVLVSMLPNTLLNHWNKLTGFMINSAQPVFAVSGGAITAASSAFKSKVATQEQKDEEARKSLEGYGIPLDVKKEIDKLIFKYGFEENTRGANDEARLCLKSTSGTSWHACDDYEEYVKNLAEVWENRVQDGGRKLKVKIVLPGDDHMVGEKGMRYFENCWKGESCGNGIVVKVQKIEAADHDSTADPIKGAIGEMFAEVK
jgi:pimeloyl-ACP methyl ester carboxylesterase